MKSDWSGWLVAILVAAGVVLVMELWFPSSPKPSPAVPKVEPVAKATLYVFTRDNCLPCERLKKSLKDERVAAVLKNYIVTELDVDSDEAKAFHVRLTPTLVLSDLSDGTKVKVGYQTPEQLLEWLQ